MKKLTKLLSLILVTFMLAAIFCSCSKSEQTSDGVSKVTIWRSSGHDKEIIQQKVEEFNRTIGKDQGIEIDYVVKEGNLEEMVDLAYTTDQAPDMYVTYQIEARAQKGQIVALEDIEGAEELISKHEDRLLEKRHKYEGKTYTLPVSSATYGLIYNKEMFVEAGLVDENGNPTPPETWDEVVDYAKKLTDSSKQQYGFIVPAKWSGWYGTDVNIASSAINGIVDGYDPITGKFDYSGQAIIMDAYVRMKKNGSVVPGPESLDNDPARARFGQGKIGMKIAGSYDVGVLKNQYPAEIEWGVAPLPVADKSAKGMQYCSADGMFVVNKASLEKIGAEKIVTVLEFFAGDELRVELYKNGFSIPTDYTMVKDVELGDDMENWATFASFTEFSQCTPLTVGTDMTGEKSIIDICLEIWNEMPSKAEIEERIQKYEDRKNKGIGMYQEIHPEYDPSPFIMPEWKRMR